MAAPEVGTHELELLETALTDIHATTRANDAKNPPALIVHGLLFAGTTSIVSRMGDVWTDAPAAAKVVIACSLGIALVALLVSVVNLLLAIRPRTRTAIADDLRPTHPDVLFPHPEALAAEARERDGRGGGLEQLAVLRERCAGVGAVEVREAYLAEVLKLSHLHAYKARLTKVGIQALIVEIAGVFLGLIVVGAVAVT